MTEPKPFASLSSGLLARKGTAKPAMRPQGFGKVGSSIEDLGWNDMGHNRAPEPQEQSPFEAPHEEHVPSPISALTPMTSGFEEEEEFEPGPAIVEQQRAAIEASFGETAEDRFVLATKAKKAADPEDVLELGAIHLEPQPEAEPEVVAEQPEAELEEHVLESTPVEAMPVATPTGAEFRQVERSRTKAAFTLRLDGDRHLKLRLACAVSGRSAQQLVTEALDQLLHSRPEVGALANQVPSKTGRFN